MGSPFGSSKSSQRTDQSTKIKQKISTSIGDIGLTGDDAVALANAIVSGSIEQTAKIADLTAQVSNNTVKGFEKVHGLTEDLIEAQVTPTEILAKNAPILIAGTAVIAFLLRKK